MRTEIDDLKYFSFPVRDASTTKRDMAKNGEFPDGWCIIGKTRKENLINKVAALLD